VPHRIVKNPGPESQALSCPVVDPGIPRGKGPAWSNAGFRLIGWRHLGWRKILFYNPIKDAQAGNNKQGHDGLEIADFLVFLTTYSLNNLLTDTTA
jgi:hypothetical protein